jgi:hypothetical protein
VIHAGPGQVMTRGEPTGAGSDDDDGRMQCRISVEGA